METRHEQEICALNIEIEELKKKLKIAKKAKQSPSDRRESIVKP
jgi:hypothetical protein